MTRWFSHPLQILKSGDWVLRAFEIPKPWRAPCQSQASPIRRPEVVFLLQAWSTAITQTGWRTGSGQPVRLGSMTSFGALYIQGADQPGNDHLLEDGRIGPHLYLSSEVAALRIDPCRFWDVTFI